MGISRDLIVSEFGKEDCDCKICSQLVEDPIVLKCGHFYCKKCIDKKIKEAEKLEKNRVYNNYNQTAIGRYLSPFAGSIYANVTPRVKCPECEREFNPSEDMNSPNLFMRNVMSKIQLKCSLPGCVQIVTYDNFTTHIAQCAFNPDMVVTCKYCNQLYKKRKEQEHVFHCSRLMKETVYGHFAKHSPISKDWEHNIPYVTYVITLISENQARQHNLKIYRSPITDSTNI